MENKFITIDDYTININHIVCIELNNYESRISDIHFVNGKIAFVSRNKLIKALAKVGYNIESD